MSLLNKTCTSLLEEQHFTNYFFCRQTEPGQDWNKRRRGHARGPVHPVRLRRPGVQQAAARRHEANRYAATKPKAAKSAAN